MEAPCCSVCYEDIEVEKTGKTELTCRHIYHLGCIAKWFITNSEKTCPTCRKQATPFEIPLLPAPIGLRGRWRNYEETIWAERWNAYQETYAVQHVSTEPVAEEPAANEPELPAITVPNDIQIVMEQTGVNRAQAIQALISTQGDLVDAIMRIVEQPPE